MLVEIDGLRLSIGATPILHDVHLALSAGEIFGLLGPNGAGKSTTIATAIGLLKPDAGHVRMLGKDPQVFANEIHRHLGVLPEQNGFYGWMSAEDYLAFFAAMNGLSLSRNEIRKRLDTVGLHARARQPIGTYSHGMRQRLGLARALIANPDLLILDEPTNGLDPRGRREVHDILLELAGKGVGILLCTHLLDDVERLCQRVGIIVGGRTVAEGTIAGLVRSEHRLARFRLKLASDPTQTDEANVTVVAREGEWWVVDLNPALTPDKAWSELLSHGWAITEIRREGGGLEDLYLTLTEGRAA